MSKKTMALAAMLLVGGIGGASAQGQMQGQVSGQARTVTTPGHPPVGGDVPLYRQQVPAVVPLGPHIDKPTVNPSAAGTLSEWESPATERNGNWNEYQHGGTVEKYIPSRPGGALRTGAGR